MSDREPVPLWQPSPERIERATMTRFAREHGLPEDYRELWRWSVEDVGRFWALVWEHFAVEGGYERVLGAREMPGTEWFPGARVSYAEHLFRDKPDERIAIRHASESQQLAAWTWGELRERTARIAAGLRALGVGPGDRVAAYLPNVPDTVAALLACASIGAIWSVAAPEFGAEAVVDRFAQIEPTVLLAVDGYRYGGRDFDRRAVGERIAAATGARLVRFGQLDGSGWEDGFLGPARAPLTFARVPFDHPLWILYSSGTTGVPKAIVHGHGGILLEQLKIAHLQLDAQEGDRIFWFTTTGWMMWNFLVGVLLSDASVVLYDGTPAGEALWDLAAQARVSTFGTSAAFIAAAMNADLVPARGRDLSALRAVGSTGSPLSPEGFAWVYEQLGADTWLFSTSGGTDLCTAFVGGVPTLPVYAGELQARALGAKVEAWDEQGRALVGAVGELVITEPMPSMPVRLWNDPGDVRLREAYFSTYPRVWRHGDWIEITERGSAIISGRSDATINRGGVRIGTAEIYRAVAVEDDVLDALVVDVPRAGTEGWMPLFVVLRDGAVLDDALAARLRMRIRTDCSPRHVPNEVHQVAEVPRTLSGKLLEVPVKRILMGAAPEQVASRDALANPDALDAFVAWAREHAA
ncbi:MAG: acetoacetyl-CoA synthase [Conexibacter sp.]|nr:acetoacetyl-CoA synthase [Conexibacter sp.]